MTALGMTEKRAFWPTIKPYFTVFDGTLTLIVCLILIASTITMCSPAWIFQAALRTMCAICCWPSPSCGSPPMCRRRR